MKVFSGLSNQPLAQEVANYLHLPLSQLDIHVFPDGERRMRIHEDVVGERTVVIQSANTPVDTNYMELFFLLDALKRSGAEYITAVVPYFGYQRQDHVFREGEAVSLEVIIRFLESLKVDKLVSFDMHTPRIPDLFHIPVAHLSALPLFAEWILGEKDTKILRERNNESHIISQYPHIPISNTVLVSPDRGGIGRIKALSSLLENMPYAVVEKNRDLETGNVEVHRLVEGDVAGYKRAILVDDMIASGKTIALAAQFLKEQGIEEVEVFATHAVFSEEAPEILQKAPLDTVTVTDTVAIPQEKRFEKLHILSIAPLIAKELESPTVTNNPLINNIA